MVERFNESNYENGIVELFVEELGYTAAIGSELQQEITNPFLEEEIENLYSINFALPKEAVYKAIQKIRFLENGTLEQRNALFTDYLQNGVPVSYRDQGNGYHEDRNVIVKLIDYDKVNANSFYIVQQFNIKEYEAQGIKGHKRPDIVLFINGLPLVVMELKSPYRELQDEDDPYKQIRNAIKALPTFFSYNAICVISDQLTNRAGTITSSFDRFMEWKSKDGTQEDTRIAGYNTFFEGIFEKSRLLDIIKNFICYVNEGSKNFKIMAAYHQYFAVNKAIISTKKASVTDGKGGVFWHTQGSGKSLSMVFYTQLLQKALQSPTIVVVTDRNDLDDQLFAQFSKCREFLRQTPIQAESRAHLVELLENRKVNGIIFTTMQKFEESDGPLNTRNNIIVIADEAHRGQYGLVEKVDEQGNIKRGIARMIRDALPNATYIGFTGTPISQEDRSTREVFGDYIDIYDMTQAVKDDATRPVYYESRVIKLNLDQDVLSLIDAEYDIMATKAEEQAIEKSKRKLSTLEAVLGHDNTIESLVEDMINHYEREREQLLTGKAMIVAYSRPIAMKIYHKMLEKRPDWQEKVAVVMTGSNSDPEEWQSIIGNKAHKVELANSFKDNSSPLKIAIVVDMWLTGFDVPSLATMYIYKQMKGHNLMQAIARVNRVFEGKSGGLIVDYVGIARALKQAMNDYTKRDQDNYGDMDIAKTAYPKFQEKLSVCRDLFHGFDYSSFFNGSAKGRSFIITEGLNFMLDTTREETSNIYLQEALVLHKSLSLCSSLAREEERIEAAYFEAVRVLIERFRDKGGNKIPFVEINKRINELLKHSIQSQGVVALFTDLEEKVSLFDPEFLADVAAMKQKNLAIEMLKRLIGEQISVHKRQNFIKAEKFSELMNGSLKRYINGLISNEEVIAELLELAKQIAEAKKMGEELGLTADELAFYDALTQPQAVKDFYTHDALINITKELVDMLRKNRTVDWRLRESAQAKMRRMVKRLLRDHRYPPGERDGALEGVMRQCELWADNTDYDHQEAILYNDFTKVDNRLVAEDRNLND